MFDTPNNGYKQAKMAYRCTVAHDLSHCGRVGNPLLGVLMGFRGLEGAGLMLGLARVAHRDGTGQDEAGYGGLDRGAGWSCALTHVGGLPVGVLHKPTMKGKLR